jgi:hypothetical protein
MDALAMLGAMGERRKTLIGRETSLRRWWMPVRDFFRTATSSASQDASESLRMGIRRNLDRLAH